MPTKKQITTFISYAHTDSEIATKFLDEFSEMLLPSAKYEYDFWRDKNILPGENWHHEIQDALIRCSMGIVLVSPAFLGSKYVSVHELPALMNRQEALLIPVMLRKVNFERHDLKGLKEQQIFQWRSGDPKGEKSYAQCGKRQRYEFVFELFDQVELLLDKPRLSAKHDAT
jgi:hypothetical protein